MTAGQIHEFLGRGCSLKIQAVCKSKTFNLFNFLKLMVIYKAEVGIMFGVQAMNFRDHMQVVFKWTIKWL